MTYFLSNILKTLLLSILLNLCCSIYVTGKNDTLIKNNEVIVSTNKESGLTLDIARHFYSADIIKGFIDDIENAGGTFLHLHFSDHENYALESIILDQKTHNAYRDLNGNYINPNTNKAFLSREQLKEIIMYAKEKKIEIIPELGSPNHMTAIFNLLEKKQGKDYVKLIKSKWNDEELDITNSQSIAFIKSLMLEVIDIFADNAKHFHIGGDEFGYSLENNYEFINYVNNLAEFLSEKGLITRVWNDGIIKSTLTQLDHRVQITYWSYDGDTEYKDEANKRRQIRASMPELIESGFKVLNYNSYYLYINPKQGDSTAYNSLFAMRDLLKNWELGIWDGQNRHNKIINTNNILGASFSIWGEDAGSLSSDTIRKYNQELLKSFIWKTNAKINSNNFPNVNAKNYIDLSQAENNSEIQLENHNQTIQVLQEESDRNITIWIKGFPKNQIILPSHWKKRLTDNKKYELYEYKEKKLWVDKNITIY